MSDEKKGLQEKLNLIKRQFEKSADTLNETVFNVRKPDAVILARRQPDVSPAKKLEMKPKSILDEEIPKMSATKNSTQEED